MSNNVDIATPVKAADQVKGRETDNEQRVPGTPRLFPSKPGPMPGRSPLFRR